MTPRDRERRWTRRILCWNVKVGRRASLIRASLLLLAAMFWPHYIVLQEARRFNGTIPGYRRHAADGLRTDSDQNVILVRKGLDVEGTPLPVDNPDGWVHKEDKPARTFYATRELKPRLTVVNVHRCTKGFTENLVEWRAEHEALALAARLTAGPIVLVGDWNAHPDRRHPQSPQALAREIGGEIVAEDEDDIDYGIVRGVRATIRRLRNKRGSDHRPFVLTIKEKS